MSFRLEVLKDNDYVAVAEGNGHLFAKKNSMIADQGRFRYSKRLLGTNDHKGFLSQVGNHLVRRFTGENLEIVEISGEGAVYLADKGHYLFKVELEPTAPFKHFYIESENILAFTETCEYGVDIVGTSGLLQKDLFKSKFTYNGSNATIIAKSVGMPLMLEAPCRVDPDALIAWVGAKPKVVVAPDVLKSIFGQHSGESYLLEFTQPGQVVIVQPSEQISQVGIGIDDRRGGEYNSN